MAITDRPSLNLIRRFQESSQSTDIDFSTFAANVPYDGDCTCMQCHWPIRRPMCSFLGLRRFVLKTHFGLEAQHLSLWCIRTRQLLQDKPVRIAHPWQDCRASAAIMRMEVFGAAPKSCV